MSFLRRNAVLVFFPAVKLGLHVLTSPGYGYFRDELYYLASTDHLDFGYVDHPPLSIALLAVVRWILGDSLPAIRLIPALAGAANVFLTGLIARELEGGRFAQALAMLSVLVAPELLALNHFYSMNALDLLIWTLSAHALVRLLKKPSQSGWLLLGVILGLGLQNKLSVLWLGMGMAVGLVLAPERRWLSTRGPWLAAGVAFLIFLPHVLWSTGERLAHSRVHP